MEDVSTNQPSTASRSGAARRLAGSVKEIAERWEERLRRELPAARLQSHPDLINTLPQYLEQLALTLATGGLNRDALEETSRHHAAERAQQPASSLEQLLVEYTVLHETILDVLQREGRLDATDERNLLEAIEHGMKDAASEYVRVLRNREETITGEARQARTQIDTLLQGTTDGVVTVDFDRRYLYMNDEGASILSAGRKNKEELLGKTMMEEPPATLGDRFFWAQIRAIEHQTPVEFEEHLPTLGRWLQVSVYPSPTSLNIYFRDLTQHRQAELELRHGEERFRSMVESVKDYAIFMLHPDGTVASWNSGAQRIKQYRAEEIIGTHFRVLYRTEDAATGRPDRNLQLARIRGRWEDEWWRRRKDGSDFWANVIITALYDDAGRLTGFTKVIRDLTERKRREENEHFLVELTSVLSTSIDFEDSLRQVAQLVVTGSYADWCTVVTVSTDRTLQRMALVHRDVSKQDFVKRIDAELPSNLGLGGCPSRVLRTGSSELVPVVDGSSLGTLPNSQVAAELLATLGIESYLCVPLATGGRMLGVITFVSADPARRYGLSDLRFAEEVGRRAALTIDAVYSRRMIGAREEVLATVSHDLRSPLSAILSGAEMLAQLAPEDATGHSLRRQSGIIYRAARRMERLISDLLDLAKIEAGRFVVDLQPIDARALLHEVVESHEPAAREKSIHLATTAGDGPCELLGDRDRILQVLGNLVGNAIKFTPEGGDIALGLDRCGDEVQLSVRDTGPGISEIDRAHIFERYWQAEPMAKGGAGLGLFITKGIIEAHGGKIWLESEPGVGSTFRFTVPSAGSAEQAGASR
jgi:PAS domain S-box-containing protein